MSFRYHVTISNSARNPWTVFRQGIYFFSPHFFPSGCVLMILRIRTMENITIAIVQDVNIRHSLDPAR